ncbi:unnamed protein product [Brassica oleracea]
MLNPFTLDTFFNLKDQTFRFYFLVCFMGEREREIARDFNRQSSILEMLILCKKLNIFEVLWLVSL